MQDAQTHEDSQTLSLQERAEILEEHLAQAGRRGMAGGGQGETTSPFSHRGSR